jgi:hypothetical protein
MMVHFFGILQPLSTKRHQADEAPNKSAFFGPDDEVRTKKNIEENTVLEEEDSARERQRFLLQSFSPHF